MKTNTMELKVMKATIEVESRKVYEDEISVNLHEVLDNLDSLSILTRSTEDNLLVIAHMVKTLVNDGYLKILDDSEDNFTFKTTLDGYTFYEENNK